MRALVVFESMFGNTQTIAEAIADGLSRHMQVDLVEVGVAPTVIADDVDLIIVGGPTHAFGMSRPSTREDAVKRTGQALVSTRIGLREWLDTVQGSTQGLAAAAFDTTLAKPRVLRFLGQPHGVPTSASGGEAFA